MAFYSFVVKAPHPMGFKDPIFSLDEGINTFNAHLDGADDEKALSDFLARLRAEGVEVMQTNRLDQHEPGNIADLLLPGESPDKLLR